MPVRFLSIFGVMHQSLVNDLSNPHANADSPQGKALLSLSGAMIFPGVGHFLVGCFYMGLLWFSLGAAVVLGVVNALVTPDWIPALGVIVPAGLVIAILQMIDALRCARRSENDLLHEPSIRYVVAVLLLAGGLAGQHRAIRYLQNNVFEICYTPTPSMAPLLAEGDRFVTLKSVPFRRWDIVGFNAPEAFAGRTSKNWMKRVVGLPGEKIEITPKGVLINGKQIEVPAEAGPYLCIDHWTQPIIAPSRTTAANGCWGRPITLGTDEYFLLGDNTEESFDARLWPSVHGHQPGAMPKQEITCKVVAICWPPARMRMFK